MVVGPWSRKDGGLYADRTPTDSDEVFGAAFCTVPYTPGEEFDLDAEFTSHESTQASIILPLIGTKTQVECTFFYILFRQLE